MSDEHRPTAWDAVRTPLITLAVLWALLGASTWIAFVPLGTFNVAVNLGISAIQTVIVATVLMELARARTIQRWAAGVGIFWLIFLFTLSLADYLTR
jgi:caa(3)-type oxidase subunit IV